MYVYVGIIICITIVFLFYLNELQIFEGRGNVALRSRFVIPRDVNLDYETILLGVSK